MFKSNAETLLSFSRRWNKLGNEPHDQKKYECGQQTEYIYDPIRNVWRAVHRQRNIGVRTTLNYFIRHPNFQIVEDVALKRAGYCQLDEYCYSSA